MRRATSSKPARELWVIKAGSAMVIEGGSKLINNWMKQTSLLKSQFGIDVIWVTSGAIATARLATLNNKQIKKHPPGQTPLEEKQALSALGQPMVMDLYRSAMRRYGRHVSQVLLTAEDLAHKTRRRNLMRTLTTLVQWDILPILNENDAVSTEEIQFGDNDKLSALVARAMQADRLILLTDVDGLYSEDPKKHPGAQRITQLKNVSGALIKRLTESSGEVLSKVGTGGMLSKILAARLASRSGIPTHLVRGSSQDAILKIVFAVRNGFTDNLPGTTIGITKGSRS